MFWAISAQWVLLFMRSNSMSDSFLMRSFLKPLGSKWRVLRACWEPMTGMRTVPLNRRLTEQSTPLGFLQDFCKGKIGQKLSYKRDNMTYVDAVKAIRLESVRVMRDLLDNLGFVQWLDCHYFIFNTHAKTDSAYKFSCPLLLYGLISLNKSMKS